MEKVDPRKVLEHLFQIIKIYPDESLVVYIYTSDGEQYEIKKINNKCQLKIEDSLLILENINQFLNMTSKQAITDIDMDLVESGESISMFGCHINECVDIQRLAAKKIQKGFRKSRKYAEWAYNPERLQKQGYFNIMDFGKKRKVLSSLVRDIKYLK
jgi:hypothetical protein